MHENWCDQDPDLRQLSRAARAELNQLRPMQLAAGKVLFSPGNPVEGYVIVLSGRVGVHLFGPTGRDILLYEVAPGQSCIQSTLGLLGGDDYTAEAVVSAKAKLVLLPKSRFLALVNADAEFRQLVFSAFAERLQSMMQLIESVTFMKVETRLANLIERRADASGTLHMTQADMATAIGSAREVVSRRIDKMTRAGIITHERGILHIQDRAALGRMTQDPQI